MADTMVTGADSKSKEELMNIPSITHTQDISIIYIVIDLYRSNLMLQLLL